MSIVKNVVGGVAGILHDPLRAVKNIGKFEGDHISNVFGRAKIGQLIMGAADPFAAHVQNKLFGTHYKPLVSQLGGARQEDYRHAASRGINTGPSQTMGTIADMLAIYFGTKGLGNVAGNIFGAGATTTDVAGAAGEGGDAAAGIGGTGGAGTVDALTALGDTPFLSDLGSFDVGGATGMGGIDTVAGEGFATIPSAPAYSVVDPSALYEGDLFSGLGGDWSPSGTLSSDVAKGVSDIPRVSNVGGPVGMVQSGMKGLGVLGNLGALYTGLEQRRAGKALQEEANIRRGYAKQLQALEADPSSITSTPGYQAGLDAIQRSMAAQGYMGSGNMMVEMAKYGQGIYDQRFRELSSLASGGGEYAAAATAAKAGGTARSVVGAGGLAQNISNLLSMWG